MLYFRSFLFSLYFYLWTLLVAIIGSPLLFASSNIVMLVGRVWARGSMFGLKYICGLVPEIRGQENLPAMPYIIASKHQSALETVFFHLALNKPAYVLKKELIWLPFFGIYLLRMGMIVIDRSAGISALKSIIRQSDKMLKSGRPVVIFPEGTRTIPGQTQEYQPGIAALYAQENCAIIPVALNTGTYWPKNSMIKKPGTFIIEFLPAIEPGLKKAEFMTILADKLETHSKNLLVS